MLHGIALGKPHKRSWTEDATVSYELALKDIHSVTARVSVMGIVSPAGYRSSVTLIPVSGSLSRSFDMEWSPDLLHEHFGPFDIRWIHYFNSSGDHARLLHDFRAVVGAAQLLREPDQCLRASRDDSHLDLWILIQRLDHPSQAKLERPGSDDRCLASLREYNPRTSVAVRKQTFKVEVKGLDRANVDNSVHLNALRLDRFGRGCQAKKIRRCQRSMQPKDQIVVVRNDLVRHDTSLMRKRVPEESPGLLKVSLRP